MQPVSLPDGALDADRLRALLDDSGYSANGVIERLGTWGNAAVNRGDVAAAEESLAGPDPLAVLIRLFLLGREVPEANAARIPAALGDGAAAVLERTASGMRARFEIRPVGESLLASDFGVAERPGPLTADHVLGVGAASLTLSAATPRRPVRRALDLGTGCGIQAVQLAAHAESVIATDVTARAVALASLSAALSGRRVEVRRGDLLEPVAGERFDLVVSNPPFVMGAPSRLSYRDSPMPADGLTAHLAGRLGGILEPGGVAQLLGSWLHVRGQDWRDRWAGWLAGGECDAIVLQRELIGLEDFVALWALDGGQHDPDQAERWLQALRGWDAEAVGFGLITLRRTSRTAQLRFEEAGQSFPGPVGESLACWLDRLADDASRLPADDRVLRCSPAVTLLQEARPGASGWELTAQSVHQRDGLGWILHADPPLVALLAGCDGRTPLGQVLALLEAGFGVDPAEGRQIAGRVWERGLLTGPDEVGAPGAVRA